MGSYFYHELFRTAVEDRDGQFSAIGVRSHTRSLRRGLSGTFAKGPRQ